MIHLSRKSIYAALGLAILASVPVSFLLRAEPAVAESPTVAVLPGYPSTPDQQPTTSGAVYRANLDARIENLSNRRAETLADPATATLAALHFHRFKLLGRIDDLQRARALLDARLKESPDDGQARRVRAHVLAGMHRFDDALADLAHPGTSLDETELQFQIALATGRYAELEVQLEQTAEPIDDFYTAVQRGNLAMLNGRLDTASVQFFRAQQTYRSSNPYPLAWLHTQQGIALLRTGDCRNASRFFAAAVERLPDYYLAVEHLAECERQMGQIESARARYEQVIKQTGQPEFIGALADLEHEAGNHEVANQLDLRAEAAWNRLLETHGSTFADHAVDFFLDRQQPERALTLARSVIEGRQDVLSLILHARVAFENDRTDEGCTSLAAVERIGLAPPELADLEPFRARCTG